MPGLNPTRHPAAGFTLAELAVVLVIVALMAGSLALPLAARIEEGKRRSTQAQLGDIEQALIGFAIIHRRLPCPSQEADPASPGYGLEPPPPCDDSVAGRLPWRTLGLPATDAWGSARATAAADWGGHWHYRVDLAYSRNDTPIGADTATVSTLQVFDHDDRAITVASPSRTVAIVYSTGPNRRADGRNATHSRIRPEYQAGEPTADFDDLLIWIGQPLLIARLAQAGRL